MIQHLPISCPKCGLDLSVRVQNLGRKGICKHCGHVFRAQLEDILELLPVLVGPPDQASEGEGEGDDAGRGPQDQARALDQIRTLLASQPSGPTSTLQRIDDMEGRLAQFHGPGQRTAAPGEEPGADEADENAPARVREVEALRGERNRLWGEAQDLRARMEAQSAEARERTTRLTRDRDAARAEAERVAADRDAMSRDWQEAREQLESDRDALAREVDRLQHEAEARDRSREELEAGHANERLAWEDALREGEERWARERDQLAAEAEHEIGQLRDRLEADQQAWSREREAHAKVAEERGKFAREVGQLRDRLDEMERARGRAEAELGTALARREEERRELEARWDQQRRELLAEANLEAGRKWLAERDRLSAERDALASELERLRGEAASGLKDAREHWEREARDLLDDADHRLAGLAAERDALAFEVNQWRDRVGELERSRSAGEAERDGARARWASERQGLEARWEEERRKAIAAQQAGREHLDEVDRLIDERDAMAGEVGRLRQRLDELERRQADGDADVLAAGARWDEERRDLEAQWERRFQALRAGAEQRLAEREEQFEADRESLQKSAEALQNTHDALLRERDEVDTDRASLRARLQEFEAALRRSEQARQAEKDQLVAARDQARREAEAAARVAAERAEEVRARGGELEQRRRDLDAMEQEHHRTLDGLRREWSVERQRWVELLAAAQPGSLAPGPRPGDGMSNLVQNWLRQPLPARDQAAPDPEATDPASPTRPRPRGRGDDVSLNPRPQASSYHDPGAFRSDLERWLAKAEASLRELTANPARAGSESRSSWLGYEIRTARAEILRLPRDPA